MSRGTICGFDLKPEMLHSSVSELQTAHELLELQELYSGKLDIFLRKGGGFLVALSNLVLPDEVNDMLCELCEALIMNPTLLNLSELT
jgi:hypothetical protein